MTDGQKSNRRQKNDSKLGRWHHTHLVSHSCQVALQAHDSIAACLILCGDYLFALIHMPANNNDVHFRILYARLAPKLCVWGGGGGVCV